MQEKINICQGVNFINIEVEDFKTQCVSLTMLLPLDDNTVARNAVLPYVLRRACKGYNNFTELNRKLASLYGAELTVDVAKIGCFQALVFSAVSINNKFALQNEDLTEEISKLLTNIIFEPSLENETFKKKDVEQAKRQVSEIIDAEFNDKQLYAKQKCIQLMFRGEKLGICKYGTKEEINNLTENDIYLAWNEAIKKSKIEIITLGKIDSSKIIDNFKEKFKYINRDFNEVRLLPGLLPKETKKLNEIIDVEQAKLVMGFKTGILYPDDKSLIMDLINTLYGSSVSSKLFLNVREKLNLCYFCSSSYDKNSGIVLVQSGVEKQNIQKAIDEIIKQLDFIKIGNFTSEEFEQAKLSCKNKYLSLYNNLYSLESWYLVQALSDKVITPKQAAQIIDSITKESIIETSKKIILDSIYTLTKD